MIDPVLVAREAREVIVELVAISTALGISGGALGRWLVGAWKQWRARERGGWVREELERQTRELRGEFAEQTRTLRQEIDAVRAEVRVAARKGPK